MPQSASIALYAHLQEPIRGAFRDRLDSEARRVGVSANHGDWVAGLPLRADGEGDDGACVACEVVFAAGLEGG